MKTGRWTAEEKEQFVNGKKRGCYLVSLSVSFFYLS
jgi:hypothetical protein